MLTTHIATACWEKAVTHMNTKHENADTNFRTRMIVTDDTDGEQKFLRAQRVSPHMQ